MQAGTKEGIACSATGKQMRGRTSNCGHNLSLSVSFSSGLATSSIFHGRLMRQHLCPLCAGQCQLLSLFLVPSSPMIECGEVQQEHFGYLIACQITVDFAEAKSLNASMSPVWIRVHNRDLRILACCSGARDKENANDGLLTTLSKVRSFFGPFL